MVWKIIAVKSLSNNSMGRDKHAHNAHTDQWKCFYIIKYNALYIGKMWQNSVTNTTKQWMQWAWCRNAGMRATNFYCYYIVHALCRTSETICVTKYKTTYPYVYKHINKSNTMSKQLYAILSSCLLQQRHMTIDEKFRGCKWQEPECYCCYCWTDTTKHNAI